MNLKIKTEFSDNTPRGLLFPATRLVCLVGMAFFMGQAIVSGVHTLGTIIYNLFPVFAFGGIFLLIETQKDNFASLLSLPTFSDIKTSKKYLPFFVIFTILGIFLVFRMSSPVDLVIVLLIILAAGLSAVLMFRGQGIEALFIFILAWPFMIFERSAGNIVFRWTNNFNELNIGIFSEDIAFYFYFLVLIGSWLLRVSLNKDKIKFESWAPGFLFLLIAGIISTIFSTNPLESWPYLINYYFIPFLFFILCVNEINSWNDFKKLSLAIGIMMAVVTIVWLYYALYRTSPVHATTLRIYSSGGLTLGSRYLGYGGVYYEYLAAMTIPIILALAFSTGSRIRRNIWIAISLLMIGTTLYTFGRNGYILLAACLLPWFWSHKRGRLFFLLLLALLFTTQFFGPEIISYLLTRFKPFLSWQTLQGETRIKIWAGAFQMCIDYPWSGVGIRMYSHYAAEYGLSLFAKDANGIKRFFVWTNAHGMIFQIISELGLLGLIGWCGMFWIPIKRLIKPHISLQSLLPKERYWMVAMKSNTIVVCLLFLLGPFGNYGIESIRICIFILFLATIHIMDNFHYKSS